MANIDRIVNATINLASAAVAERSYGDMLIISEHNRFSNRVQIATSIEDVEAFGFKAGESVHTAASNVFAQRSLGGISRVFIGRKAPATTDDKGKVTGGESWTDALAACRTENPDWFGLVATTRDLNTVLDIAKWAEARDVLYGTATADWQAADTTSSTDVLARLKAGQYFRTFAVFDTAADKQYIEAAWLAKMLAQAPGSENWANQRLAGIESTQMLEGQAQAVHKKNGNTFERFRNIVITQKGQVSGGEWIDVIRFRDWLLEQIRINTFTLFVDRRVPGNDDGIGMVRSRLLQALELGVTAGGIDDDAVREDGTVSPGFTITTPRNADRTTNERAGRHLKNVLWSARLRGSINDLEIRGTLNYDV